MFLLLIEIRVYECILFRTYEKRSCAEFTYIESILFQTINRTHFVRYNASPKQYSGDAFGLSICFDSMILFGFIRKMVGKIIRSCEIIYLVSKS